MNPSIQKCILRPVRFPIQHIRLELDQTEHWYYTELSAVALTYGAFENSLHSVLHMTSSSNNEATSKTCSKNYKDHLNFLERVPIDVFMHVSKYIDIPDIISLFRVSKQIKAMIQESRLLKTLDLSRFWMGFKAISIRSLPNLCCNGFTKLDLSWCGLYMGQNYTNELDHFFMDLSEKKTLSTLTHLRLNNSVILLNTLKLILQTTLLVELSVSGSRILDINKSPNSTEDINDMLHFGSTQGRFANMNALNISGLPVTMATMVHVLDHACKLEHLDISNCLKLDLSQILTLCPIGLKTLQAWRVPSLHQPHGLLRLTELEELDIGWVLSDGLGDILKQMNNLKKLFLSANRNIEDSDLSVFADHCAKLEQLDLVGNRSLTPETLK
ncbi:hypothetical protein TCAL_09085, partial [Tigriopus californicus]